MLKTRRIKVKNIRNGEIPTVTEIIKTTTIIIIIIIIVMMNKICNRIKM